MRCVRAACCCVLAHEDVVTLPVLTAVPRLLAGIHPCARALATMVVRTLLRWPAGTAVQLQVLWLMALGDRATVYGVHRWCDEACIPIDQSCDGVAYPPCSQFFSCDSCTQADAECCGCVNVCGHDIDVHDSCFRLPTAHPTR